MKHLLILIITLLLASCSNSYQWYTVKHSDGVVEIIQLQKGYNPNDTIMLDVRKSINGSPYVEQVPVIVLNEITQ